MTRTSLIRSVTKRLDTLHSASYFAPTMMKALESAGVPVEAHYLAQRSAPLGTPSAELVVATFFNYAPAHVATYVPACWEAVRSADVTAARIAGVEAMSAQILASDAVAATGMDRAGLASSQRDASGTSYSVNGANSAHPAGPFTRHVSRTVRPRNRAIIGRAIGTTRSNRSRGAAVWSRTVRTSGLMSIRATIRPRPRGSASPRTASAQSPSHRPICWQI